MSEAPINVAIVGSRNYPHLDEVYHCVGFLPKDSVIVSGGALGVDFTAKLAAYDYGLECAEFLPDWQTYGKRAGAIRNRKIVDNADVLIAFWDGESKGTMITVDMARKAGKKLAIVCPGDKCRAPHEVRDTLKIIFDVLDAPSTERTR